MKSWESSIILYDDIFLLGKNGWQLLMIVKWCTFVADKGRVDGMLNAAEPAVAGWGGMVMSPVLLDDLGMVVTMGWDHPWNFMGPTTIMVNPLHPADPLRDLGSPPLMLQKCWESWGSSASWTALFSLQPCGRVVLPWMNHDESMMVHDSYEIHMG